ncbi:MAG TPA: 4'-phosphopantetheinyl transferase superfamily protein [Gaiellaceae bacterium]
MSAMAIAPPLDADDVQVWEVRLGRVGRDVARFWRVLSEPERSRARRFRFARDRRRYVVMRGVLRTLLGRHLDVSPARVRFGRAARGKPVLAEPAADVRFNVTHAGAVGLVAFALGRDVGVDVERPNAAVDPLSLAGHFFAPSEVARLRSLPEEQRERAFLECWTRKEAYTKALGLGLFLPLDSFEVAFGPGVEPALVAAADPDADGRRFAVLGLPAPRGYVGALVVEKHTPDEAFSFVGESAECLAYAAVRPDAQGR